MKVNKLIGSIATVAFAMISSASAQTAIDPAVPVEVGSAIQEMAIQDAASYSISDTGNSNMVVSEEIMPAQPAFEYESEPVGSGYCMPAPVVQSCDCFQNSCTKCCPTRERRACGCKRAGCQGGCEVAAEPTPMFQSCEGDLCKLSIKKGKETKTCFKSEQETICIPAVRLPWQDCCPPSKSRTRLVTRLKTEKKEVDSCSYKWSVEETNDCGCEAPADAAAEDAAPAEAQPAEQTVEGTVEGDPAAEPAPTPEGVKETFEENVVPPAPKVKGAFLKAFRQR